MSVLDKYNLTDIQKDRVMTKVASTISELEKSGALEKVAVDWHSPLAQTGLALAGTAVATGITLGVPKLVDAIRSASIRRNKDQILKDMKAAHPDLKNVSQRDLDLAFNSIAINSPDVLKDPLLGGQVMKEITGRAMRWDLNQYSTLSRTAGGGLADYEHSALQNAAKGVGNLANVYYDASHKQQQSALEQKKYDQTVAMHNYNTQRDQRAEQFRNDQFTYQKGRDTAADAFNQQKHQFEVNKQTSAEAYQSKQLANADRQFNAQEARDTKQQDNFERTFRASEVDRTFSREMQNKNYAASQARDTASQANADRQFNAQQGYQSKQLLNAERQFSAQQARDTLQQRNFERTFNANKDDRKFSQDMQNKNYAAGQIRDNYNMGQTIDINGTQYNKRQDAFDTAYNRAAGELGHYFDNQGDYATRAKALKK